MKSDMKNCNCSNLLQWWSRHSHSDSRYRMKIVCSVLALLVAAIVGENSPFQVPVNLLEKPIMGKSSSHQARIRTAVWGVGFSVLDLSVWCNSNTGDGGFQRPKPRAVAIGSCSGSDLGTEKQEKTWTCNWDGTAECEITETICRCNGELRKTGGRGTWKSEGLVSGVGGTWSCYSKCRGRRGSSGSQSRQRYNFCRDPQNPAGVYQYPDLANTDTNTNMDLIN